MYIYQRIPLEQAQNQFLWPADTQSTDILDRVHKKNEKKKNID